MPSHGADRRACLRRARQPVPGFRGDDCLDELTTTSTAQVWIVRDGKVAEEVFDPRDVGIELMQIRAGTERAAESIGAGAARRTLERWVAAGNM